ncbi:acylneuraminate cytidylyltransferase family protein [Dolichospermum circinale]|uniref:acylneuraminate cytidylyltransferase family protein n=1 Tax=Dolichospermum circinale TaxID=109265 RepID=UPI00232F5962|nr:acylneuraminate cytidylyltransferase family protein [Dolichospermum circinale]MDB9450830.1 acylneuraminate cytidylyltransferase family protein [Dolichospermum circinale CS-547]
MSEPLKIVALLPMKANSERVKGKNFKPLYNKPLFQWVLDSLTSLPQISKVVINTDARDILAANQLFDSERVEIRDRKPEICGDFVSMNLVIADDIANVPADVYLMTHTTNPLLSDATIQKALQQFLDAWENGSADSLFTVNRFQTRFYRQDGTAINHDPNNLIRTQDLEPWYEENSNLYIFTAESFAATGARIGKKPILFETPRLEAIDIDDQTDWNLAESVAQFINSKTI